MKIKEKILLIEDERTIRGFMQAILTANGYDVLMAGTGAMANTMISSHCPDPSSSTSACPTWTA